MSGEEEEEEKDGDGRREGIKEGGWEGRRGGGERELDRVEGKMLSSMTLSHWSQASSTYSFLPTVPPSPLLPSPPPEDHPFPPCLITYCQL